MKKNFFYYLSPSIITGIVSVFIIVPVSTYYLNPEDFGAVAILTFFSALLVPLSSTGVTWVLAGNYYKLDLHEKKEMTFNLFFVGMLLRTFWLIIFALAGIALLPKLVKAYENSFLKFFWILIAAEWFNACWELASYVIILQKKAKLHAAADLVRLFSNLGILLLCLVVFRLKTVSLVLAYLGMAVGGFIFSVMYIKRHMIMRLRLRWIREIVNMGFPTIPLNLFEVVSTSIGRFFIERWIGLAKLGIYSHSQDYEKMFMLPYRAFAQFYCPEVLEAVSVHNAAALEKTRNTLKKWFGLLAIAGSGVALFSRDILNILTHGKFTSAAPLVTLWFALVMVYSFGVPYTQFLLVKKKTKFVFYSQIVSGLFSWVLIALGVRFFGIIGAVFSVVFYFFILHLSRRMYARKLGSVNFEGRHFLVALTLLFLLLVIAEGLAPSFFLKSLLLTATVALAVIWYDLHLSFVNLLK